MDKKEIYEHLANIYLDASLKSTRKKRKLKSYSKPIRNLIIGACVVILALGSKIAYSNFNNYSKSAQIALFLYQDTAKLNFNFDPAKKETFSLDLKQLSLAKYKSLAFALRLSRPQLRKNNL